MSNDFTIAVIPRDKYYKFNSKKERKDENGKKMRAESGRNGLKNESRKGGKDVVDANE